MAVENLADKYAAALKKLLPRGSYWDNLLADVGSDVSVVCVARAQELANFRQRMDKLMQESYPSSADETMERWEKVYLDCVNDTLPMKQRRVLLLANKSGNISVNSLKTIARAYGASISYVEYPYSPAAFGHTAFGSYMASPASQSVIFVHAEAENSARADFEQAVSKALLANQIIFFFYGGE